MNTSKKRWLNVIISLLYVFTFITLLSCNSSEQPINNVEPKTNLTNQSNDKVQLQQTKLYSLRLYNNQVKALFDTRLGGERARKIILQFYIHQDSTSPKLFAYPSRNNNRFSRRGDSQELWIDKHILDIPKSLYFGDNQVRLRDRTGDDIKSLLDNNIDPPYKYEYLLFTPFIASTKHVYYTITVVPSFTVVPNEISTQPSPPADAD